MTHTGTDLADLSELSESTGLEFTNRTNINGKFTYEITYVMSENERLREKLVGLVENLQNDH